jgi:hypothetical protein
VNFGNIPAFSNINQILKNRTTMAETKIIVLTTRGVPFKKDLIIS